VIEQAAGLALLAALSPAALLVAAVYLGSARPRQTILCYLAGAVIMSTALAVVVLVVLRSAGLSRPEQHPPRDGLRLGLGLLLLAAGILLWARRRGRPADQARKKRPGVVSRLVAKPTPRSAFVVGILVFAGGGVTFIAALQVIATARASIELTVLAVAVVVLIDVFLVWLPLIFHLAAPRQTEYWLRTFNGWLRAHSSTLMVCGLIVVGAILAADGGYGLVAGT